MAEQPHAGRPFVVLIANDQEWSARSLDSILSPQGFTVIRAYTGQQALDRARTAVPDLVILDAQLPDLHGMDVCRQLQADPRFGRMTPIIITTAGPSGRAQRLAAYEAGAWEFYGQPLDGEALLVRLKTFLAAKLEADGLRHSALLDAATGLYTLHGLARRIQEIGSEAFRFSRPLACVGLSLLTEPHNGGPARLRDVLRAHGRTSDAIAKLESDEFLVVAPGTDEDGARRLVGRIDDMLRREGAAEAGQLIAGYSAVKDVRAAAIDPAMLLDRATAALRYLIGHRKEGALVAYDDLPAQATPV